MTVPTFILFLVQLATMAACGLVGGAVMRLMRQPAVLGEMVGGILLGPTVFGTVVPEGYSALFPTGGSATVLRDGTVKLGMLFFMFTVGLEINPRGLRQHGIAALVIGLVGTLVPLAVGTSIVYLLPDLFPVAATQRWPLALFVGAALANSANPVLARILLDLGLLKDRLGATIMSAIVVDDLVSWSLLFLVFEQSPPSAAETAAVAATTPSLVSATTAIFLFFAAVFGVGRLVASGFDAWRRALPNDAATRLSVVSIILLLTAAVAEHLGIHAFLGPFLFGIALAPKNDDPQHPPFTTIRRFSHAFFVPIYFVSLGLTTNFVTSFSWPLVLVICLAAMVGKIPAAFCGAKIGGLDTRSAWAVGCGMNARGAIGIILANLGLERGVIDRQLYVALVVMAIATSLAAGPSMQAILRGRKPDPTADAGVTPPELLT